jgi:WD40 repeat protein
MAAQPEPARPSGGEEAGKALPPSSGERGRHLGVARFGDKRSRYAGVSAFDEVDSARFFGRAAATEELLLRVLSVHLLLQFAPSGVGKTSLLNAGLFPRLREHNLFPFVVRLNDGEETLVQATRRSLEDAARNNALWQPVIPPDAESFGQLLAQVQLWDRELLLLTPVVVFDQFEEIFTLRDEPFRRSFAEQVGAVSLRQTLQADGAAIPGGCLSNTKVVISLREEYLGKLDEFSGDIPELFHERLRLAPLTTAEAIEAIVEPAKLSGDGWLSPPFEFSEECLHRLIDFIDGASEKLRLIEPSTLQLVCRRAEAIAAARADNCGSTPRLEFSDFGGVVGLTSLVENFFVDELSKQSDGAATARRARRMFERGLINADGRRLMLEEGEIERRYDVPPGLLGRLVESRLLRREPRNESVFYEISHDRLADAIAKTRAAELPRWVWPTIWGGVAVLAILVLSMLALVLRGQVVLASDARRSAESRELANRALLHTELNPARGAHVALKALELDSKSVEADAALRQSMAMLEFARLEHVIHLGERIVRARLTREGAHIVATGRDKVWLIDANDPTHVERELPVEQHLRDSWWLARASMFVTWREDGHVALRRADGSTLQDIGCAGDGNFTSALALSPDERYIAAGCYSGEVRLWEVIGSGVRSVSGLEVTAMNITALAFSADSRFLAVGNALGEAMSWDIARGQSCIGRPEGDMLSTPLKHSAAIRAIAFDSSHPSLLATASDDKTATIWGLDLEACRLVEEDHALYHPALRFEHERLVTNVRLLQRDGRPLLMTVSDTRVRFWPSTSRSETYAHGDWVLDADVSEDGELAISASNDGTAGVWWTRSAGTPVAVLRGHGNAVTGAFFTRDKRAVTSSGDGSLRIWQLHPPRVLHWRDGWVLSAAFDGSGSRVLVCGEKGSRGTNCSIGDLTDGAALELRDLESTAADAAATASWSFDGTLVAARFYSYGADGLSHLVVWNTASLGEVTPRWLSAGDWHELTFSAGGNEFVTLGSGGSVAVWSQSALQEEKPMPRVSLEPKDGRSGGSSSPDGRWLATIDGASVSLYSIDQAALPATTAPGAPRVLDGHRGDIRTATFSADSRWLVTASNDGTARVWSVVADAAPARPSIELAGGHVGALSSAVFSRDGQLVITGSADHSIRVWSAQTGKQLGLLRRHGAAVNTVATSPNGTDILSASDDGTVRLGRCEACTLPVEALRQLVPERAVLAKDEQAEPTQSDP